MGTKRKAPEVLDRMVEHLRYELTRSIEFVAIGNAWCEPLPEPLRRFAEQSILEAGLVHFRCLIEFLGDPPKSDRVMARDYLPDWAWTTSGGQRRVAHLHGRLAHLGVVRSSVGRTVDGGYSWREWLDNEASGVLRAARDFLVELRTTSPDRYALIVQPGPEFQPIDLIATLDPIVGSR